MLIENQDQKKISVVVDQSREDAHDDDLILQSFKIINYSTETGTSLTLGPITKILIIL